MEIKNIRALDTCKILQEQIKDLVDMVDDIKDINKTQEIEIEQLKEQRLENMTGFVFLFMTTFSIIYSYM